MKKEWKPIEGYEGYYEVSNYGEVKSLERKVERCDGVITTVKEKMLVHTPNSDGYPTVHLSKDGNSQRIAVHILVARAFVTNPNGYKEVNHLDFDRTNCRSDNLEWIDHGDNVRYTIAAGRHICNDIYGEKNPNYRNTTLKKFYAEHPEERMKLARPGAQNGRCVPVTLIEPSGKKTDFRYMGECARYMINEGYTKAKDINSITDQIRNAMKMGKKYKGCNFI